MEQNKGADSATPIIGEKKNDTADRLVRFNQGLRQLAIDCEMDITAEASIVDGRIIAIPRVVDTRKPVEQPKADESIAEKK